MKCNQSRPGFELVSSCPFPTTLHHGHLFWLTVIGYIIYIILLKKHHHLHHQVTQAVRISLTHSLTLSLSLSLSLYPSLSSIAHERSYKRHHVSAQSLCKWVLVGRPTLARLCVGVYRRTSHEFVLTSPAVCPHVLFLRWEVSGHKFRLCAKAVICYSFKTNPNKSEKYIFLKKYR